MFDILKNVKFSTMIGRKYVVSVHIHLINVYGELVEWDTELPIVFDSYKCARLYMKKHRKIGDLDIKHFKIKKYDRSDD